MCSRYFTQFHAIFTQFGLFQPFLGQFQHVGYQMHVLELRNSLVILSKNFTRVFTQFHAIFTQFWLFQPFLANFNMLGIKKHVLEPRNSSVILSRNFTHLFMQFHTNFMQFSRNLDYFRHFWANFNMLGIKKHILKLRNSLMVLGEAIGLKEEAEGLQMGLKAPYSPPQELE